MVAVGLMAILLTMIAVIFYEATQAFRVARASIEIHESARSALNSLVNDLTSAEFTAYDNGVQGYFALSQGPTDPTTGNTCVNGAAGLNWRGLWINTNAYAVNDGVTNNGASYLCIAQTPLNQPPPNAKYWSPLVADTMTFTTLAPQPGARYAAPESVEQLALVRYALEWDGGYATVPGGAGPQPTYNLVKRVRFPCTSDPNLNMDQFSWAVMNPATGQPVQPYQYLLPMEYTLHTSPPLASTDPDVVLDAAGLRYAQAEVIAFHVLSMNVRLFCLPAESASETSEVFVEAGFASALGGTSPPTFSDTTKNWPVPSFTGQNLRVYAGTGASQWATILSNTATVLTLNGATGTLSATLQTWAPPPDTTSQYRVDGLLANLFPSAGNAPPPPGWYQRGNFNFLGTTNRPPAIVEVTLQVTDVRATHAFTFTQRFYIPASERPPHN